jgi:MFS family permease
MVRALLPRPAVMLTTIMVVLDMTIANVTLPYMMGVLGATTDQVSWVLTPIRQLPLKKSAGKALNFYN